MIKKCLACGQANGADEFFCRNCSSDISAVETTAEDTDLKSTRQGKETAGQPKDGTRICPRCGQSNPSILPLCSCGHKFPTAEGSSTDKAKPVLDKTAEKSASSSVVQPILQIVVGSKTYDCKDGDILGREGTVASQIFAGLQTVSRKHVLLVFKDGHWQMVSLADKNKTRLDGKDIPKGIPQTLSGEHRLEISTKCLIQLRVS